MYVCMYASMYARNVPSFFTLTRLFFVAGVGSGEEHPPPRDGTTRYDRAGPRRRRAGRRGSSGRIGRIGGARTDRRILLRCMRRCRTAPHGRWRLRTNYAGAAAAVAGVALSLPLPPLPFPSPGSKRCMLGQASSPGTWARYMCVRVCAERRFPASYQGSKARARAPSASAALHSTSGLRGMSSITLLCYVHRVHTYIHTSV